MPDEKLTPVPAMSRFASPVLTGGSSLARNQAAEVTAKVIAERLVAQLEQAGFASRLV